MSLEQYKAKRDFKQTSEPAGKKGRAKKIAPLTFVVQKHAASHLHYDFRLEMGGVLKSWAVPKGFPHIKGDRRLAMQVEDHPVEYGGFEGTIPPGNYGAGTVMLWDFGAYNVVDGELRNAFDKGKLPLELSGKKLKGRWTLVRMKPRDGESKISWLMIKSETDAKPISTRADDKSAKSGKTMKQIAGANGKVWQSNKKSSANATNGKNTLKEKIRVIRAKVEK
jgi:bifunctional non-homologous end joining protein LigD